MNGNENKVVSTQNINIDPEHLKIVVGVIKRCAMDLKNIKKKSDEAWADCRSSLGENVSKSVDIKRESDRKKFEKAIEQLEHNADVLNTVASIWKDTETEILSSSKEFDEIINKINNNLSEAFGLKAFKMMNNQNDSSHI